MNTQNERLYAKKLSVVVLPLYHLEALKFNLLRKYHVLYWDNTFRTTSDTDLPSLNFNDLDISISSGPLEQQCIIALMHLFTQKQAEILQDVALFAQKSNAEMPEAVLWGTPPISFRRSTWLVSFLKSQGVKVIGSQHGGNYVVQKIRLHLLSDFQNATHYLSYGFDKQDFEQSFKQNSPCEILPVGHFKNWVVSEKNPVDILFPITNTMNLNVGGHLRILPNCLLQRQIDILSYLNTLKGVSVVVKPMPYATPENYAPLLLHHKFKNLKFIENYPLPEFLQEYKPRAVLIEFPSTPLYDVLELDAEIFLMNDTMNPFEKQALTELQKRVHYTEDTEKMVQLLDQWAKGNLSPKRDNTFYNHYVHKENTKENILQAIQDIIQGK